MPCLLTGVVLEVYHEVGDSTERDCLHHHVRNLHKQLRRHRRKEGNVIRNASSFRSSVYQCHTDTRPDEKQAASKAPTKQSLADGVKQITPMCAAAACHAWSHTPTLPTGPGSKCICKACISWFEEDMQGDLSTPASRACKKIRRVHKCKACIMLVKRGMDGDVSAKGEAMIT